MNCVHCQRSDADIFLFSTDGPVIVCSVCVLMLGGAANDPTSLHDRPEVLRGLRKRHRAVVALMEAATGHPAWAWIAGWPEAKA